MCEMPKKLKDNDPAYQEETLETAGCTGGCPYTGSDIPPCDQCPQFSHRKD